MSLDLELLRSETTRCQVCLTTPYHLSHTPFPLCPPLDWPVHRQRHLSPKPINSSINLAHQQHHRSPLPAQTFKHPRHECALCRHIGISSNKPFSHLVRRGSTYLQQLQKVQARVPRLRPHLQIAAGPVQHTTCRPQQTTGDSPHSPIFHPQCPSSVVQSVRQPARSSSKLLQLFTRGSFSSTLRALSRNLTVNNKQA